MDWGGLYFCRSEFSFNKVPAGKPQACAVPEDCRGHRMAESAEEAEQYRFLRALADSASKDFETIQGALQEFEKVTGQDVTDEGCNCCGAPHSFSWVDAKGERGHCSGEECLQYLYPDRHIPKSIRESLGEAA